MVEAKRTYQEWREMTFWQRSDFIVRWNKRQKEIEEEHRQQTQRMRGNVPRF